MELIWLLVGLIIVVIVIALLWNASQRGVGLLKLGEPWNTLIYILCILIVVAIILYYFGGLIPGPFRR